jgi:hypothetical protein
VENRNDFNPIYYHKKFAMDFSQQKRDLNAEQKKTAALEQCLKEIESALTAGKIPTPLHTKHPAF